MTGVPENDRCYFCGGKLEPGSATIPFMLNSSVVIVKQVPAKVCTQCGEPIMSSEVAAVVDGYLKQAQRSGFEVSIITYGHLKPELALA
jgi:YgiT-type zinc finger domain-containing protein